MKQHDLYMDEIIKCYHCGNETPMKRVGEHRWGSQVFDESDFDFLYKYELYACPVCHRVTLRQSYSDETMIRFGSHNDFFFYSEKSVLYPLNTVESPSIPAKVKEAYQAALRSKSIDNHVCLMALRRTLEILLKDKGATKWGLKDKIEEIAAKGLLPEALKEASSLAKMLGDTAAHDKSLDIDQDDVEAMAEFVGFIIEYLYIVPDKICAYKKHLSAKTQSKKY